MGILVIVDGQLGNLLAGTGSLDLWEDVCNMSMTMMTALTER
jgi:hypothetical protein